MNKLLTAEDVLVWAYDVRQHEDERFAEDPPHAEDRATAAELARGMRLLRVFRELDAATCDCRPSTGCDESCEKCDWDLGIHATLIAALEEPPTR